MSERVYSYDDAFAAMCLWEEVCDPQLPDAPTPWQEYRDAWGSNGLRDAILTKLANACDQAWNRTYASYETAHGAWAEARAVAQPIEAWRAWEKENPEPKDPGSFDWEFVPTWIRLNVDWSDMNEGPRVRGAT